MVLDISKESYPGYEKNVLVLPKFEGEANDEELYKAIRLLKGKSYWPFWLPFTNFLLVLAKKNTDEVDAILEKLGEDPIQGYH